MDWAIYLGIAGFLIAVARIIHPFWKDRFLYAIDYQNTMAGIDEIKFGITFTNHSCGLVKIKGIELKLNRPEWPNALPFKSSRRFVRSGADQEFRYPEVSPNKTKAIRVVLNSDDLDWDLIGEHIPKDPLIVRIIFDYSTGGKFRVVVDYKNKNKKTKWTKFAKTPIEEERQKMEEVLDRIKSKRCNKVN